MNCKICKTEIHKSVILKDLRVFHYCHECDFISLDSAFILNQKEEKSRYDLHQNSIENEGYVSMFQNFIKAAIKPYVQAPSRLLDFGSGPSPVLAELLSREGFQTEFYDPYYAPIDLSSKAAYDLISSTEVFEHFNNPMETIEQIVTLLKPNAFLSIMTMFACNPKDLQTWWYKNDETHISFYGIKTLQKIAQIFSLELIWHNDKNIAVFQKVST